ncbi:TM0106 family RecB-like putative nuclease [Synechococcus elongatus IITB4]|uniref:TM0106 family RecB-like putative nuclease n=1 Tax=Synechococcus elongatus TaxID=32046 RepID=UPI0030D51C34
MGLGDADLLDYLRCARRLYLNRWGDRQQAEVPNAYLQRLRHLALERRREVAAEWQAIAVDPSDRAASTLDLMAQGVDCIEGAHLQVGTDWADPDLLIRQPGQSIWGDWIYQPAAVKLAKKPKTEYLLQLAFQAELLTSLQGTWPEQGWLLLRDCYPKAYNLELRRSQLQTHLEDCRQILARQREPELFISRSRCDLCIWQTDCRDRARDQVHLSLLPGVSPSRFAILRDLKLDQLEALATADPQSLAIAADWELGLAQRLVQQAAVFLDQQPQPLQPYIFPDSPIEIFFDIEAQPDLDLCYLHGVLIRDRHRGHAQFEPLLAEHPDQEGETWRQLMMLLDRHPQAPIYHFCSFEVDSLRRLGQRYGLAAHALEPVLDRFIDIHAVLTRSVLLPTESYALKSIARWLGFDWRDTEANGSQAILWYDHWLETGDRTWLDRILLYNEDDCQATAIVKDWLADFLHEPSLPAVATRGDEQISL